MRIGKLLSHAGIGLLAVLTHPAATLGTETAPPTEVDAAVTSIINVPVALCGVDSIAPIVTLKNNGTLILGSAVLLISVNGGATTTFPWVGSLQSGQTVTVPLPTITVEPGPNSLVVRATEPNGTVDAVPENDAWTIEFTANVPPATISLILTLDDQGSDVSWELATQTGTVLYEGGPYADGAEGEVDSVAFCLTNDCYTFTIHDVFGNGLCCADGEGNYVIRDSFGTVYGESDGQYGDMNVNAFCLSGVNIMEQRPQAPSIHPNPSNGTFDLVTTSKPSGPWRIVDGCGRTMHTVQASPGPSTRIALDLPNGVYLIRSEETGALGSRLVIAR